MGVAIAQINFPSGVAETNNCSAERLTCLASSKKYANAIEPEQGVDFIRHIASCASQRTQSGGASFGTLIAYRTGSWLWRDGLEHYSWKFRIHYEFTCKTFSWTEASSRRSCDISCGSTVVSPWQIPYRSGCATIKFITTLSSMRSPVAFFSVQNRLHYALFMSISTTPLAVCNVSAYLSYIMLRRQA